MRVRVGKFVIEYGSEFGSTGNETRKKSNEQLLKLIAEGAGKIPASKLTTDEQKQALGYVRSLVK